MFRIRGYTWQRELIDVTQYCPGAAIQPPGAYRQTPRALHEPQPGEPGAQRILETRKAAIATSGSYQNSLELLDKRYIHILNPATGQPVKSQTASVTVIDEESTMRADALATALMVIPAKDALRLADEQGIAAHLILLDEQGRLVSRSSMAFDPWSTTTKP